MSSEQLFQAVNFAPLPFWALMIFVPRWWLTREVMRSSIAPTLFAGVYAILVVPWLPVIIPIFLKPPDLEAIARLLGDPEIAVVAWVHYLAFDLFVGRWEYLDATENGINEWLVGPALFLTLMLGPAGFLMYLAVRRFGSPKSHPVTR